MMKTIRSPFLPIVMTRSVGCVSITLLLMIGGCGGNSQTGMPKVPLPVNLYLVESMEEVSAVLGDGEFQESGLTFSIAPETVSSVYHGVHVMRQIRDAGFTVGTEAEGDLSSMAGWILVAGSPGHRSMPAESSLDLSVRLTDPVIDESKVHEAMVAGIAAALDGDPEIPVARLVAGEFGPLSAEQALDLGLIDFMVSSSNARHPGD